MATAMVKPELAAAPAAKTMVSLDEVEKEVELRARELQLEEAERDVQEAMLRLRERQAELRSREIDLEARTSGQNRDVGNNTTTCDCMHGGATHAEAALPPHAAAALPPPPATVQTVPSIPLPPAERGVVPPTAHTGGGVYEHPLVRTEHNMGGVAYPHTAAHPQQIQRLESAALGAGADVVASLQQILVSAEAAQRNTQSAQERLMDRVGRVEQAVLHPLRASGLGKPLEEYVARRAQNMVPRHSSLVGNSQQKQQSSAPMPARDLHSLWQQQETWQQRQQYVAQHEPLNTFNNAWGNEAPGVSPMLQQQPAQAEEGILVASSSGPSAQPGVMAQVQQAYVRQALRNPLHGLQPQASPNDVSHRTDPVRAREIDKLYMRLETLASAEKDLMLLLHEARDAVHFQVGKVAAALEERMEQLLREVGDMYSKGIDQIVRQREVLVNKIELLKTGDAAQVFAQDEKDGAEQADATVVGTRKTSANIRSTLWELESNAAIALRSKLLVVEGGDVVSSTLRRRLRVGASDSHATLRVVDALIDVVESTAADSVDSSGKYTIDNHQLASILRAALTCVESSGAGGTQQCDEPSVLREKMFNAATRRAHVSSSAGARRQAALHRYPSTTVDSDGDDADVPIDTKGGEDEE